MWGEFSFLARLSGVLAALRLERLATLRRFEASGTGRFQPISQPIAETFPSLVKLLGMALDFTVSII